MASLAAVVIAAASLHPAELRAPPTKRERPVPFAVGEKLTYDVSWSSYVTAGAATLSVQEKKPSYDSLAYYIVAEGRPGALLAAFYDLYYKADTLLDAYSLLPQRGSVFSREGKRERMKTTMFNHKANTARYEVQTRTLVKTDLKIHPNSQDPLGTIYLLRSVALKAGGRFSVPVCDAGETYTVDISVSAPELVTSGIGEVRAWKITPRLPKDKDTGARALTLWISDDARRLPVRMRAQLTVGSFDLILRSAGK